MERRDEELLALQKQAVEALVRDHGMSAIHRLIGLAANPFQVGFAYGLMANSKSEADQILLYTVRSGAPGKRGFVKGLAAALFFDGKEEWASRIVNAAVKKELPEAAIVELLLALPSQRSTWDSAAALGHIINASYWKDAIFFAHKQAPKTWDTRIEQMVAAHRAPEVVEWIASDSSGISSSTFFASLAQRQKIRGRLVAMTLSCFSGVQRAFSLDWKWIVQ